MHEIFSYEVVVIFVISGAGQEVGLEAFTSKAKAIEVYCRLGTISPLCTANYRGPPHSLFGCESRASYGRFGPCQKGA